MAYWVSPTGAATWANAESGTPLSGVSCCSLTTANTNAGPGDTIYFREGTYDCSGDAINPTNSGTSGNVITFSGYANETVTFDYTGTSVTSRYAINLNSDSGTVRHYIKVTKLLFTHFERHLWILKGGHNEISYCSFLGWPTDVDDEADLSWSASYIYRQAMYNWVHHCTFGIYGWTEDFDDDDFGVVFQCGLETDASDLTKYNLIEDCHMYHGGHHVVSFNGSYNIYRNNYFHNEIWSPLSAPEFSTRTMFQTGVDGDGCYNLVHGNRFGYGGPKNKNEIGGAGGTLAGAYNIWRQNEFVRIYTDGMYVNFYPGQSAVAYNKVYNNVFWYCGYGDAQTGSPNWDSQYTHAIDVVEGASGTNVHDNAFKNNLFYQNKCTNGTQYSLITRYYSGGWVTRVPQYQILANNWLDNAGDPKFVDITGTPDPMDEDQFDFSLQSDSPCIDSGGFLTTITSETGSGTSFVVDDAGYFFFPWGSMDGEILGAALVGDTIQFEGQTSTAIITSIDYDTNTITVDQTVSWTQGDGVALEYNGTAPDIGAYEYVDTSGFYRNRMRIF